MFTWRNLKIYEIFKNATTWAYSPNFQDTLNPLCSCCYDVENTCHFLLPCPNFLADRNTLFQKVANIDSNISNQSNGNVTKALLVGNSNYSNEVNLQILNVKIDFILTSKWFDNLLKKFSIVKVARVVNVKLSFTD